MTTQIIGSVSHGTMMEDDLIPCFIDTVRHFDGPLADRLQAERDEIVDDDFESLGYFLNETLFDTLQNFAPSYFYFGSHPGDGSDYGFWLCEGFEQDFVDNGGLKVSDTSEVPADYSGEVLQVSDHGNPTLYSADNGKLTEIWSLV